MISESGFGHTPATLTLEVDWVTVVSAAETVRVTALEAKLVAVCDVVRELERRANDYLDGNPGTDAVVRIQAVEIAHRLRTALGMPVRPNRRSLHLLRRQASGRRSFQ